MVFVKDAKGISFKNILKGHIFPIVGVIVNALCEKISLVESCLLIETTKK
jgi:hypothetical protein